MATVSKWNPFGVSLNLTATAGTVTRTSATQFTVVINASWETYYSGAQTTYGMDVTSGGVTKTLSTFGGYNTSGSGTFTGTYSISSNAAATTTITVTFNNYNTDNGNSSTKSISLSVSVPAWTSYTVSYNANGGSGAPSSQTKWKNQTLTLSTTKPTRTGYSFQGWATSASGSVAYAAGASYTANASVTLYAVWKANTYTVSYNANGGSGAPSSQTKTYGVTLTLSSTKPTRTNYNFKGWGTSASATTVSYAAGASYTTNAAITLYAVWELAYTNPRITNLSVTRCDSSGTAQTDGIYALVKFSWACDETISSIAISSKLTTASSYGSSTTVSASGTSGSVSQVVGGSFDTASSYNIKVIVTDSVDSTEAVVTLSSMRFSIHAKPGGTGIAFGKMHEIDDCAEFGWDIELNGHDILNNGASAFAPTGYGLGVSSPWVTLSDLDNGLANGWYVLSAPGTTLAGLTFNYAHVRVSRIDAQHYQELIPFATNIVIKRFCYNGTWYDWKCENPPMVLGTEYLTTESYQSKSVYTKLVSLGTLPNTTTMTVSHGASATRVLRVCGVTSTGTTIPYRSGSSIGTISANTTQIAVYYSYDASSATGVAQIWYTKD